MMYSLIASSPVAADMTTHPFWIFDWTQVPHPDVAFCCVVLFLSGVLCSAAGIGGGGIYVAVLMVAGGLTPHDAVPLSKAIVFLGSISSLILNLRRSASRDATGQKPCVIDYNVCRLVVPAALIGTLLGVLLNRRLAGSTIVFVLTAVLVFMTFMVTQTAVKQYWSELAMEQGSTDSVRACSGEEDGESGISAEVADSASDREPLLSSSPSAGGGRAPSYHAACSSVSLTSPSPAAVAELKGNKIATLSELRTKDVWLSGFVLMIVAVSGVMHFHTEACRAEVLGLGIQPTTKRNSTLLLSSGFRQAVDVFVYSAVDSVDSEAFEGHIQGACLHPLLTTLAGSRMETWMSDARFASLIHSMVLVVPMFVCIALAIFYAQTAINDQKWTLSGVAAYQSMAVATGLLAGLVGVGGGLIFSPFFLVAGMDPSVAVGTSATCVIFTSSSTTLQYVFTDRIVMSLALAYGLVNLVASYVGTSLVHLLQDKCSARKSYITFIVAAGVALSTVLSVVKFVALSWESSPVAH